jgi:hypothetical protein
MPKRHSNEGKPGKTKLNPTSDIYRLHVSCYPSPNTAQIAYASPLGQRRAEEKIPLLQPHIRMESS